MKKNPTLNQIIAVATGRKTKAEKYLTAAHHTLKPAAITGLSRTYQPIDEDGEQLQAEGHEVQGRVVQAIALVCDELASYYDVVATQEHGNTTAQADVVVGDKVVLADVAVTVLLFLEKRLVDLRTFIAGLPTLPADKSWAWDANRNCYVADPEETRRTNKIPVPIVLYEATTEHPAQVQMHAEDRLMGHWTKTDFSGAIPQQTRSDMASRCDLLLEAVKTAREEANSIEVEQRHIGDAVLDHVFGDSRVQSKA